MSSLNKVTINTSKIAISCLCLSLIACEPLLLGGAAGLAGSSSGGVTQCATGPSDLSGQCRNLSAPTPGALEAIGESTTTAALNIPATTQIEQTGSTLINLTWSPYSGTVAGYYVYYGPTSDTANTLASDLEIGTAIVNASTPSISYEPTQDLGISTGATVCFKIYAYDKARVPYDWSQVQCTVA